MCKDSRYNQIQAELADLFKDVPIEQMQLANRLIQRVAFMQITLEEMFTMRRFAHCPLNVPHE